MLAEELARFRDFFLHPSPWINPTGVLGAGAVHCILVWLLLNALADFWVGTWVGMLEAWGCLPMPERNWELTAHNPLQRLWEEPASFTLVPTLDEIAFRFGLLWPAAGVWLFVGLLPTVLKHSCFVAGLTWFVVAIFLSSRLGSKWFSFWRARCHEHFCRHFGCVLHVSVVTFAVVECMRGDSSGPDLILAVCAWHKGLVLAWVRLTRGILAAIFLHAASNLCSDTLAWLYKDVLGVNLHWGMCLASFLVAVRLFVSLLPAEITAWLRQTMASLLL